jgi:hypothetical protein
MTNQYLCPMIARNIKYLLLFILLLVDRGGAARAESLRPPSVPLVACDPYFSIWSPADKLTDVDTAHWSGVSKRLTSLVRIDGKTFRLMGLEPADVPALPQSDLEVLPTRTIYTFNGAGIKLTLTFTTADLPEDLNLLSRPITYVTWEAESTDLQKHTVSVYFDASSEIAVNTPDQPVDFEKADVSNVKAWRVGTVAQPVLQAKGDDVRIDWGYFYVAVAGDKRAVLAVNSAQTVRAGFIASGSVGNSGDEALLRNNARNDSVIAYAVDLGAVKAKPVSCWIILAYDDLYSIQYMKHNLRPYWRRNGWEASDLLKAAAHDYPVLKKRCAAFDEELMADLRKAGGENYAEMVALAFRQCFAAGKFAADANGQPMQFCKENHSNGCISTSDVFYPMSPQFLFFGPTLAKSFLVPFMNYAASDRWTFPFAPHDLGTYPQANGQVYGGGERDEHDQMPVEESGNLIILMTAIAEMEGNAEFAGHYWKQLEQWAAYLKEKGFDPENQLCTDDFAGHLAHNVNLSAKAICALGAFAKLCEMRGDNAEAAEYSNVAHEFARRWIAAADDGDHFRLAFDRPGTWSQKYNLVWDRILGLHLFPESVAQKEMTFYRSVQNQYGLPLDNRRTYTKLDWTTWTATLTQNRDDFEALVSPVVAFLNTTPDRTPMSDWYETKTARRVGFDGRPVVGGVFLQMLYDKKVWHKYAARDRTKAGNWAPPLGLGSTASTAPVDSLETGFLNPPDSAKPHTWWQWMNGNITREGITADLEAMKQIGLGGATVVNLDCDIPRGNTTFMSPEWREDFKFAVQEANRLGFDLSVENCAGWSSSGGPWNSVTNAMQCLTSSEIPVKGPEVFDEVLPQPSETLDFYRDIAVLAFKANEASGAKAENLEIKRAVYGADGGGSTNVMAKIVDMIRNGQQSIMADNDDLGGDPAPAHVKQLRVEYTFNGTPGTVEVDEDKALIYSAGANQPFHAGSAPSDHTFVRSPSGIPDVYGAIPRKGILDLTAKLGADGHLKWKVPPGNWIILRLGYTPIGMVNHPAPQEGTGLECDKLSKAALDAHWDGFMQKVLDDIGPLAGKTLKSSFIDSYEVGNQDWTADFRQEFEKRRGYDPLKYLPTSTGCMVDSPEVTERFLWDMRRTIADLFAENYYGHFAELCRQHGLASDVEPYTGPYESLQCGQPEDTVMGEFWTGSQGDPSVKLAASVAHIYGKTIVGAESFTAGEGDAGWQYDPYAQKTLGDLMFCRGVNRYYFHRYAMQPWTNRWPGMTMGPWGFNFERTVTWWTQGKAWIDYISRSEFLLQQGSRVADAAYFDGESAPVEMPEENPTLPPGYDYDAVDADVLLHGATVKDGRLTLASGASYAMLILPPDDINMTPPLLECLRKLVRAGAVVVGPRPQHSPSLADYPKCDAQVKKLAGRLWGKCDGVNIQENNYGQGRVIWGKSLADVFGSFDLPPDFEFQGESAATQLAFTHRSTTNADIYFVSNQRRQFDVAECTFRVSGKIPELWHSDTGIMEPAPVWSAKDGRTTVHLNFDPAGSVFVIFRRAADNVDQVVATSGDFSANPSIAPKLDIQHAVYTAVDGAGGTDVTEKVSALVQAGQPVIAGNDLAGRDPAIKHKKELRVDYTLDGQSGHATARENEALTLPATSTIGLSPQWETITAPDGSPEVKVWSNGQAELHLADGRILHAAEADLLAPQPVTGTWNLSFPTNWGAPPSVTLGGLISWTDSTNAGVRYFSGTATYEKDIDLSADSLKASTELWLDLGTVKNFAEVSLNGQNLGVLWKPPFRVNITSAAKPGLNHLVVKVTNLWPNRLIGDEQLPPDCEWNDNKLKAWPQWLLDGKPSPTGRLTFTTWHHLKKDSSLLASGLLGPVILRTAEIIPAK